MSGSSSIQCSKCGQLKPRTQFSQKQLKAGQVCKSCQSSAAAPVAAEPVVEPAAPKVVGVVKPPTAKVVAAPKVVGVVKPPTAKTVPVPKAKTAKTVSIAVPVKTVNIAIPVKSVAVPAKTVTKTVPTPVATPAVAPAPAKPATKLGAWGKPIAAAPAPKPVTPVVVPTPKPVAPVAPIAAKTEDEVVDITVGDNKYDMTVYKKDANPAKQYGKAGRPIKVLANHYRVTLPKSLTFYQYDVKFSTFNDGKPKDVSLPKEKARIVVEKVKKTGEYLKVVADPYFVFDGKNIGYSTKKFNTFDGQVEIDEGNDKKSNFSVILTLTPHVLVIDAKTLSNKDHVSAIPPLDMYHVYEQTIRSTYFGRSVFNPLGKPTDIGYGSVILWGYTQSFRLSDGGFFNVMEPTASNFFKSGPLVNVVTDILGDYILKFATNGSKCCIGPQGIRQLAKDLHGVKVTTKHLGYSRDYAITGIADKPVAKDMFEIEENGKKRNISVADYFREHYKITLRYPGLPCIMKGQTKLPMEVCSIKPGQRRMKKLNGEQQQIVVKSTAIRPDDRRHLIEDYSKTKAFTDGNNYLSSLNVQVSNKMTEVTGRVLPNPSLLGRNRDKIVTLPASEGQYNIKDITPIQGTIIKSCALIVIEDFNSRFPMDTQKVKDFYNSLGRFGVKIDSSILAKLNYRSISNDLNEGQLRNEFVKEAERCKKAFGPLNIIFVVLPSKSAPMYRSVKRITDTYLNTPSQCIVYDFKKINNPQYIANVCLKINTKLGGANAYLNGDEKLILSKNTMLLGADVTHPMRDEASVSIAAVVASLDPHGVKYIGEARVQQARQEIIEELEDIMVLLLTQYKTVNKKLPANLIFYRDGVGDGQLDIVLNQEIPRIFRACSRMEAGYQPKMTFLVVQKRHNTRLFPISRETTSRSGNLIPGVVIDTTITDKFLYDFFLQSHNVLQGTGRCGYYAVLYDSIHMSADELQQLTYYLCYTFCRCNKSISVCAPARYAHHLAFRHRDILGIADGDEDRTYNSINIDKSLRTRMYFV